jgi:ankyrin repeat protein
MASFAVHINALHPYIANSDYLQSILEIDEDDENTQIIQIQEKYNIHDFHVSSAEDFLKKLECIKFWGIPIPYETLCYVINNKEEVRSIISRYNSVRNEAYEHLDYCYPELKILLDVELEKLCLRSAEINLNSKSMENIVKLYPNGIHQTDRDWNSMLHVALNRKNVSFDVIKYIYSLDPQAISTKNRLGMLPIHCASKFCNINIIKFLLDKYADAVKELDRFISLPIHTAIRYNTPDVIKLLIDMFKEGLKQPDKRQNIPLHYVSQNDSCIEVLKILLNEYSDGCKIANTDGELPLHYSIKDGSSIDLIMILIDTYPDSLNIFTRNGHIPLYYVIDYYYSFELLNLILNKHREKMIPIIDTSIIHLAISKKLSIEVIKLLYEQFLQNEVNNINNLHCAITSHSSIDVVEYVINKNPESVAIPDSNGNLPLHYSINNIEIMRVLLSIYPDAAKIKNNYEFLPIHLALDYNVSSNIIIMLIEAYPDCIKEKGRFGNTPLHYAAENRKFSHLIKIILDAYPEGKNIKNDQDELPVDVAKANKAPLEIINYLSII